MKTGLESDLEIVKCPKCGNTGDIQYFDVLGADPGNIFCTQCHCEFNPDTGAIQINLPCPEDGKVIIA